MKRKTDQQFKKEVHDLFKGEYIPLEKYISSKVKVEVLHKKCGNSYKATPQHLLKGHGCPFCKGKLKKTAKQFCDEVKQLVGMEYEVLSEYKTAKSKVDFFHKECGKTFSTKPTHFLRGSRCPYCAGNQQKTNETFRLQVFEAGGEEYSILDEYQNAKIKVNFFHHVCGKEFKMIPSHFLRGDRCPHCFESKGETVVRKYLDANGIDYLRQYTFDDCVYKNKLRFDFFIPLKGSENEFFLLEYNGEQHYKPANLFGGMKKFEIQQKRDEIKQKYCESNNIPLVIISYLEFERLEDILHGILVEYGIKGANK